MLIGATASRESNKLNVSIALSKFFPYTPKLVFLFETQTMAQSAWMDGCFSKEKPTIECWKL